jgi:hypothetical protein
MINSKLGGFIMSVDAAQIKFIQYLDIKMRRLLSKGRDIASVQSEFNKIPTSDIFYDWFHESRGIIKI